MKAYAVIEDEYYPTNELEEVLSEWEFYIDPLDHRYKGYGMDLLEYFQKLRNYSEIDETDVRNAFYLTDSQLKPTDEEIKEVTTAMNNFSSAFDDRVWKILVLSIIHGKKYEQYAISGCCQGDYAVVYAPEDTDRHVIKYVEACYFGTGTALTIHDTMETPSKAEDVEGYIVYTELSSGKDLKDLVRKYTGCDEVVIWYAKSYVRTPIYAEL